MSNQLQYASKPTRVLALLGTLGLFALTASASADDAQALATKNQCMACHKVEGKLVGPAYKDVAAKYRGDPDAMDKLTAKVRSGGKGVWGQVPMPPNKTISDDDLMTVINWILSQDS
jgi:cytochrome c